MKNGTVQIGRQVCFVVAMCLGFVSDAPVFAQQESDESQFVISVRANDGSFVDDVNAEFEIYYKNGNSFHTKTQKLKTDSDGKLVIPYSKSCTIEHSQAPYLGKDMKPLDAKTVAELRKQGIIKGEPVVIPQESYSFAYAWLRLSHPEFVGQTTLFKPGHESASIALEPGYRIALSGVNLRGQKVKSKLFVNCPPELMEHKWKQHDNDLLVSPVIPKKKTSFRLVTVSEKDQCLFSKRLDVIPGKRSHILMKNVLVKQGATLTGQIAQSVPRPVKNGFVSVCVTDPQAPKLKWKDSVEINEDGTFCFESLPVGCVAEIVASCGEWISDCSGQQLEDHYMLEGQRVLGKKADFFPWVSSTNGN